MNDKNSRGPAAGWLLLFLVTAGVIVACLLLPRTPQPQEYHHFADTRQCAGIPHCADVVSNVGFAVAGAWGLAWLLRSDADRIFLDRRERRPYLFVFAGLLLTAFGSAYYHLEPNNARLVWDRLPMTIAFMSMVAAVIAERVNLRAGLLLVPVLLLIGAGSVLKWYASELQGAGDLRFYAGVQLYAVLVLLGSLLLPPRYTRGSDMALIAGFYVLAKTLETYDKAIFSVGRMVSGHTLKHLTAAAAGYWILRMLQKRRPNSRTSDTASFR